jgi:uncharacterized protein (TIGR01777 family)
MRVAVIGATGFIGRALVRELTDHGHAVIALTRRPESARGLFGEHRTSVMIERWDPAIQAPLSACDAVANLAGEKVSGRWTPAKKAEIKSSRVDGTRAVVEAIERMETRPQAFVCASAVGYYGDRGDEVLTEESPPGDDFLAEVCKEWEAEAKRVERLGVRSASVRVGIVMGRGGGALEEMEKPFRLGVGGKLGDGRQWVPWVHRADIAGIFRHAIEHPEISGPANGVAPEPVRNETLTGMLAQALRRPALLAVPGFALRLYLGEFADAVLGGQRVVPKVAQESGYRFRFPTLAAAFDDLYPKRAA